jgi:polysaccharide export outer membrane protein
MNNPFLEQADLRGEYQVQWTEFAKEQAHVARLQAELADKPEIERKSLLDVPIPATEVADIVKNESDLLEVRRTDFDNEKKYLQSSVQQQTRRASALVDQQRREQEGTEVDNEDLDRLQEALRKGVVPVTRVVEGKRMLLYSSTRALQTAVQLAQADREGAEAARRLERLDTDRRAQILAELQDAQVKLAGIRSRLQALSEKLVYTGMVRSQLINGTAGKPALAVIRNNQTGTERIVANEDTELQPGDVVEVALTADLMPGHAVRSTY